MTPLAQFEAVWSRCSLVSTLHAYLAKNVSVMQPDELLRAEWVARVSALDLYVHELVAQLMLSVFEGRRPASPAYLRFQVSVETLNRIQAAVTRPTRVLRSTYMSEATWVESHINSPTTSRRVSDSALRLNCGMKLH